jgi:hypothetical protein
MFRFIVLLFTGVIIACTVPVTLHAEIQYGSVNGTVKDSLDGTPIVGAIVAIIRDGVVEIKSATTDTNGEYNIDSIPAGEYLVWVTDSEYPSSSVSDSVKAGTVTTINFLLARWTKVSYFSKIAAAYINKFAVSSKGILTFGTGAEAGNISVFELNGKKIFERTVDRHTVSLSLPENLFTFRQTVIVKYSGAGFTIQRIMSIH